MLILDPQLMAEPKRSIVTGVGYRDHHVSFHRMQASKLSPHSDPNLTDIPVLDQTIWPSEVNELEHAEGLALFFKLPFRMNTLVINNNDFAGLYLADKFGVDEVKPAGLRRQNQCAVQFAQNQRSTTTRIPNPDDFAFSHD